MPKEAFLINPPRRKKMARRKRSTSRRRSYRRNPESLMLLNPPRRRKRRSLKKARKAVTRFARKARRTAVKAYRSTRRFAKRYGKRGVSFSTRNILPMLKTGAMMGAGAVVLNALVSRFAGQYGQGRTGYVVRIAGALGLGMVASRFLGRKTGEAMGAGALAVTMYSIIKSEIGPQMAAAGFGLEGLDAYYAEPIGMGAYFSPAPALSSQEDSLSALAWESEVPERLDPSTRF